MTDSISPSSWQQPRKTAILVDNDSWILPYAEQLCSEIEAGGDTCVLVRQAIDIPPGLINFMLGCTRITPKEILTRNHYNLVVHESDLPHGRGFAPLSWAILNGASEVPVCLIEAAEEVDAGLIYNRMVMKFDGTELNTKLRHQQGEVTIKLCKEFLSAVSPPTGLEQTGEPSWLARRQPADSKLDVSRSIADQFNLFRIVDNENYPAFFEHRGRRYKLSIEDIGSARNNANKEIKQEVEK